MLRTRQGHLIKISDKVNSFVLNAPSLYPLKTLENRKVFYFQGGRERVHWEQRG